MESEMKLKMFQSSSKALIFPTIFPLLSLPTVRKFSVVISVFSHRVHVHTAQFIKAIIMP